jgi:NADH-quinone oxidoreductase subunit F
MASVDGVYVGPLETEDAQRIVDAINSHQPVLERKQLRRRPCADPAAAYAMPGRLKPLIFDRIDEPELNTLPVYRRRGGYAALRTALEMTPEEVLNQINESAVRGRGGAGFQMGKKASFLPRGAMVKYLVCNADESEPGTFKDREIMQKSPHMLIEGIVIASWAAEIDRAFIYIRGEYELQADILEAAIAEAYDAGYLGERILGSEHSLSLVLHRGAGAYICGEETGLLDSLEGKRGNPRLKPPFPAIEGLYDGPTLINNVETLATVPHIIAMGGSQYAQLGTESSTGTKLVSVSGDVQRPGNYEIELGMRTREIVYDLAGGPPEGREVKFWFPGGSSAPVLTKDDLDLAYDFDTLAKAGSMLGSGAIIIVDDSHSVLEVALKVAKFYAHESCGKCVPCREGTNWTVKMLERIQSGEATPMDLDIMASVQEQIIGNCLCVLGDAMAMPIGSMVEKFRGELEAEIEAARERAEAGALEDVVALGVADVHAGPMPVH